MEVRDFFFHNPCIEWASEKTTRTCCFFTLDFSPSFPQCKRPKHRTSQQVVVGLVFLTGRFSFVQDKSTGVLIKNAWPIARKIINRYLAQNQIKIKYRYLYLHKYMLIRRLNTRKTDYAFFD